MIHVRQIVSLKEPYDLQNTLLTSKVSSFEADLRQCSTTTYDIFLELFYYEHDRSWPQKIMKDLK